MATSNSNPFLSSSRVASSSADELIASISAKMRDGIYQEAIVEWLHNDAYSEVVFRAVLSRYMPQAFAAQLPPLIWISILSMVSKDLSISGDSAGRGQDMSNPVTTKLAWIEVLLNAFAERVGEVVSPGSAQVAREEVLVFLSQVTREEMLISGFARNPRSAR
jgi:hypothetical protein